MHVTTVEFSVRRLNTNWIRIWPNTVYVDENQKPHYIMAQYSGENLVDEFSLADSWGDCDRRIL